MGRRHPSKVARCVFDAGYEPNRYALQRAPGVGRRRSLVVYFAGGLDVCCAGKDIRCRVGDLLAHYDGDPTVQIELSMRGRTPPDKDRTPCLHAALTSLAARRGQSLDAVAASMHIGNYGNETKYRRMGTTMQRAFFCLCPAGDTCVTSRVQSAIAAGCIPVLICPDRYTLPFGGNPAGNHLRAVAYERFLIRVDHRRWEEDPIAIIEELRSMGLHEVLRRQAELRKLRGDIVLGSSRGRRAGTHVLEEVADCISFNRGLPSSTLWREGVSMLRRRYPTRLGALGRGYRGGAERRRQLRAGRLARQGRGRPRA